MSNLYGYSDYNGPIICASSCKSNVTDDGSSSSEHAAIVDSSNNKHYDNHVDHDDDDDVINPLQVGFWMEGDSLAPPCGTSITMIHEILRRINNLTSNDVVYDLGCGDGRFCFEAYTHYHCRTIGIEIEDDLYERTQTLLEKMILSAKASSIHDSEIIGTALPREANGQSLLPQFYRMDLRQALDHLIKQQQQHNDNLDDSIVASLAKTGESNSIPNHNDDLLQQQQQQQQQQQLLLLPVPTIVLLYLLPDGILEIQSQLETLLTVYPQCRIVCNTWGIPSWVPIQTTLIVVENDNNNNKTNVSSPSSGITTNVYIYTQQSIPSKQKR